MLNALGYLGGVVAHTLFKWASWQSGTKQPWGSYWSAKMGDNIASAIAALVCMSLWSLGVISAFLNTLLSAAVGALSGAAVPVEIPITPGTSVVAGYLMDSIARHLLQWITGKVGAEDK